MTVEVKDHRINEWIVRGPAVIVSADPSGDALQVHLFGDPTRPPPPEVLAHIAALVVRAVGDALRLPMDPMLERVRTELIEINKEYLEKLNEFPLQH